MIIVEGPDGGGKSTLVQHIHKHFKGVDLAPHSQLSDAERNDPSYREPEEIRKRVYRALLREVTGRHRPELHDRLFFSSMIYDHIFERPPVFNFAEEKHIGRLLNAMEVPVIFCLPPPEEMNKLYLRTNQMEGVPDHIEKIWNQYKVMGSFMGKANERRTLKNPHGKKKRLPAYEYNMPTVRWYDYTDPKSLQYIEGVVAEYLGKRQKRTKGWTGK